MNTTKGTPSTPEPPAPAHTCGNCAFWQPQAGIGKGVCRLPNAEPEVMTVLANDPVAMLLTAPTFSCSGWKAD